MYPAARAEAEHLTKAINTGRRDCQNLDQAEDARLEAARDAALKRYTRIGRRVRYTLARGPSEHTEAPSKGRGQVVRDFQPFGRMTEAND